MTNIESGKVIDSVWMRDEGARTAEELIARTKLSNMASMDSGGGATAEIIYKTAWLWV
jgi:hypothetical protein